MDRRPFSDLFLVFLGVFCGCHVLVEAQEELRSCRENQNGAVRLFKLGITSPSYTSGFVQICYKQNWGNICGQPQPGFMLSEAHVVCHQLGYTGGSSNFNTNSLGNDPAPTSIVDVHCSKNSFLTILQCSYKDASTALIPCDNHDDVAISCYTERIWSNPFNGMVRLQGGSLVTEGRVEMYCNGQWGTVCGQSFNQTSADVVCRQLGYTEAVQYNHLLTIEGADHQLILSDHLSCSSSDMCLSSCLQCLSSSSPSSTSSTCQHNQDATVACKYSTDLVQSSYPMTEVDTCKTSRSGAISYAVIVGSIVGGVIAMACIIFFLCIMCYVHNVYCSKSHQHHPPTPTKSTTTKEKDIMYTSSLPAHVIRSLDAPPSYTAVTSNDAKLALKPLSPVPEQEKLPKYPG